MENKDEIIINENLEKPKAKKQKPLTEEQKEKQRINMRNYSLARKTTLSILNVKGYQVNHIIENINKTQIEMLHELQQERLLDLHTGDISQEDYKINDKLAHLHLLS